MRHGVLSLQQEDDCLERAEIRKRNSNKALAAMYGVKVQTIVRAITRAQRRKEKRV